jgi:hypothetical protein
MRSLKAFTACVLAGAFLFALAAPASAATTRVEDDDLRLRYGGVWKHVWEATSSGQSTRVSRTASSWVSASFDGTSCALVLREGPDRGFAAVYLDGVLMTYVDSYAPTLMAPRSVWTTEGLAPGPHTLKVVVAGTKSASATDRWVAIDAVEVDGATAAWAAPGTVVNNGNANLYTGTGWRTSVRPGPLGGSSQRTAISGSSVTVRFKGTGISWLGRKDTISGLAEVILDGRRVAVVGQYSPEVKERAVAWSQSGLPYGEHTLRIRSLGQRIGPVGVMVDLDAFAVTGTLLHAYRPTPFKYPWSTYIVIDKSSFKLYWVRKGSLIKVYPIAHGKASTPTPNKVWRIDAKYRTDPSSVYGPRKMRLFKRVSTTYGYRYVYTAYGIHGTNQPWVIGTRASHGCIRMYNRDVLELWPQVPIGTMVITRD